MPILTLRFTLAIFLLWEEPAFSGAPTNAETDKVVNPPQKYIAIVATPSGRFFGLDNSGSEANALKKAQKRCREQRNEKVATKDEGQEKCSQKASVGLHWMR